MILVCFSLVDPDLLEQQNAEFDENFDEASVLRSVKLFQSLAVWRMQVRVSHE